MALSTRPSKSLGRLQWPTLLGVALSLVIATSACATSSSSRPDKGPIPPTSSLPHGDERGHIHGTVQCGSSSSSRPPSAPHVSSTPPRPHIGKAPQSSRATQHAAGDGPPYSWKTCEGNLPFTTASVTLTPDRPHHGRTMTFQINGTSTTAVTGGRLQVIVYYRGWHVWSEAQELCKAVACPVQPGQAVTISNAHKLPLIAPPGAYKLRFSGSNQDNVKWVCVDVSFHVSASSKE